MPTFSYSVSNFTPFTKIRSADVNTRFSDLSTFLNTTKLDDSNIQDAGLSITKMKIGSGTSGQFISNNGSTIIWASNPVSAQYNRIVGSAAQVTAGTAGYSTIASAISAASSGDRILILPEYATTENVTVNKRLLIVGLGYSSTITGTVTFTSAGAKSTLQQVKVTDSITLQTGADEIQINNIWLATGKTFLIDSTVTGELVSAIQEG